jgi:hypothetical protein
MESDSTKGKRRNAVIHFNGPACEIIDWASEDYHNDEDFARAVRFCDLVHLNIDMGLTKEETDEMNDSHKYFIKRAKKWVKPFVPGETLIRNKPE